ncbi:MAG TPA: hypothetical protein VGY98_09835, partial [Verrucomicrobiae bacterium]|nr:hypothetical protein [Verrucomicrobiae bacterium]
YGFFWGMMSGVVCSMFAPALADKILGHDINPLYTFPFIFVVSIAGCLIGTYMNESEDEAVLKDFYKTVNPWGAWGPIREKVMQEDPAFQPNPNFGRDTINVFVGILWQLCLTALPIYLVLRQWYWATAIAVILAATTIFIKFNWYDKLEKPALAKVPNKKISSLEIGVSLT